MKTQECGEYSIKSGYWMVNNFNKAIYIQETEMKPSINDLKKTKIWKLQTTIKIKVFLWKTLSEALPVVDLIVKRDMSIDSRCQTCGGEGESINHVLFFCSLARQVWAMSNFPSPDGGFDKNVLFSNFSHLLKTYQKNLVPIEIRRLFPWLVWYIWKNMNGLLIEKKLFLASEVVEKACEEMDQWLVAQACESREH